jgi:hypothetical protein
VLGNKRFVEHFMARSKFTNNPFSWRIALKVRVDARDSMAQYHAPMSSPRGRERTFARLGVLILVASCSDSSAKTPSGTSEPDAASTTDAVDGFDTIDAGADASEADASTAACPALMLPASPNACTDEAGAPTMTAISFIGCSNDTDAPADGAAPNGAAFDREQPFQLDDDECKFHFVVRRVCSGTGELSFLVTGTQLTDGTPATGAAPYFEAALGLTHLAPDTHPLTTEVAPGTYTIGPIVLDRPGLWTMILHFYARCTQVDPASPHAHGTFSMAVP